MAAYFCDPAGAQTQNLQNRNLTLYSIELRGRREIYLPMFIFYCFLKRSVYNRPKWRVR